MASLLLRKSCVSQFEMTRHLVTDPKYGFLKELGITAVNSGLYDGKWGGSGEVHVVDFSLSLGKDHKSL